jgi:hypothetical protein
MFDYVAALSSGYLPYHLCVMREGPGLVNPSTPIKLGGVILYPNNYSESQHGKLTAPNSHLIQDAICGS